MSSVPLVALIFLLAGFTQGVTGFGSALVAMPLLTLFMDVKTAVPLCMLNGLIITSFLSLRLRRNLDWAKIMPLFFGCLPGILVGARFLREADSGVIKILLGIMLVGYALFGLLGRLQPRRIGRPWAWLAGFATGVIGSAFSAGGPPVIIYTTLTGWTKDDIKATLSVFFLITGFFMAAAHLANGLTTATVLHYFGLSATFVLMGVWTGSIFAGRIRRDTYLRIVLLLLVAMGVMMIISAV